MEMLINVKELNEVCALPDRKFSTETHFNLANREMIHEVFRYQKFHDDFADNIRYEYSTNSFLGTFKPSYDEFLKTVVKTLNLKTNRGFNDDEALTKKLLERVDLLSGLQDRKELRGEFPELNTMLTEAQEYWDEIEQEKANPIYKEDYEEERHYFFSCGLRAEGRRKGFDGFIPAQTEIYKRFITRREDYKKLAEKYSYDKFIQDNYDIDKLAMYMADKYLSICEQSPDSRKILERYNKILEKYINEPRFDKNTSIKVNGKYINYDNIMERYNILQERIKNIYAKVNWVIVPEGELDRYVRRGLGSTRSFITTDEEIERIKKVRQDKIDIRNKNKPKLLLTVYGEYGLNGYLGDIYDNGEVLLDTISTLDNAIYRIPARYFEMVSGLDKQKLMKHPAVHRLYHAGNWQKRVQKIIDQEGTQEEQEQAKMLVKRLIEENEKNIK
jgi:hypothetical protein